MEQEVEALKSSLRGERIRAGMLRRGGQGPADSSSSASRRRGESSEGERLPVEGERTQVVRLRATIANLQQHVTSRDLLISELRDRATRDAADRALLRSELREAERAALREAATQPPAPPAGARTCTLREPRTKLSGTAPVEPFVMDMMRSLMDEANISFAAVPKCIALVWAMVCVDPIPSEFLFSRPTMTAAYLRLHEMDNKAAAQRRREADAPWAFAADGGNKGTPVNLVAVSYWDSERCEPLAEPLTVAPL